MDFLKENCMYKMDKYQNLLETESKIIVLSAMSSFRSVVVIRTRTPSIPILTVVPHICLPKIMCILTVAVLSHKHSVYYNSGSIYLSHIHSVYSDSGYTYLSSKHSVYSDSGSAYPSHNHSVCSDSVS